MLTQANVASSLVHPLAGQPIASLYRLVSLLRLPGKSGCGIYNEAMLCHGEESIKVSWNSTQVDCRLKRGCYVVIRGEKRKALDDSNSLPITRLDILDKPVPSIKPFAMVPASWVCDRDLVQRATTLWDQMSRPFQHLVSAVLWDAGRFYRFVTGPASPTDYSCSNFRHAVDTAERVASLAQGLPDVSQSVVIAAALLHDAGKADDFRLSPEGGGYVLSDRGLWVGHRHTILEWLAVARIRVIVPDAQYLALLHALLAAQDVCGHGAMKSTEAIMLSVADRMAQGGPMLA